MYVHVCRMGAPGDLPPLLGCNIILRSLMHTVMVVKELTSYETCVLPVCRDPFISIDY